jgi:hypothetical protein
MTEAFTERKEEKISAPVATHLCPHCGASRSGRRSRLRWFDLPLLLLFVRPVRCVDCYERYYRFINDPS